LFVSGCGLPQRRWRFFSDDEAALVEAVTEQIIPADQDPGAKEAGVVYFIDKQLAGRYAKHQEAFRIAVQFCAGPVVIGAGDRTDTWCGEA
jgi:hypothetical protein